MLNLIGVIFAVAAGASQVILQFCELHHLIFYPSL